MAIGEDIEGAELFGILALLVVIGYGLYKAYGSVGAGLSAAWSKVTSAGNAVAAEVKRPILTPTSTGLPDNYVIANSNGVTVGSLRAGGYTEDEISQVIAAFDPSAPSQGTTGVADTIMITP